MSIDFLKLVFKKPTHGNISEYEYYKALDAFMYDIGCITNWNQELIDLDKTVLSYSCTTDNPENDQEYLNKWLEDLKSSHNFTMINKSTELAGEIVINIEQEQNG